MDLDLRGRKAILSAASKGLGKACAMSLAREGVDVTIMARTAADIEETAAEIARETGVTATPVPGDFNTKEGREALLAACPNPDIVVNNPGVRQVPGNFREWDESVWLQWLNDHFLSSVQFIQSVTPGMCERKFGRVVNMSSVSSNSLRWDLPILIRPDSRFRGRWHQWFASSSLTMLQLIQSVPALFTRPSMRPIFLNGSIDPAFGSCRVYCIKFCD